MFTYSLAGQVNTEKYQFDTLYRYCLMNVLVIKENYMFCRFLMKYCVSQRFSPVWRPPVGQKGVLSECSQPLTMCYPQGLHTTTCSDRGVFGAAHILVHLISQEKSGHRPTLDDIQTHLHTLS